MPLPDFTSPSIFPSFTSLPLTTATSPPDEYYLIGQITENMTLTKPTLILIDRTSASFALVYESRSEAAAEGPDTRFFAQLGFKRGSTLVIPNAKRTPPKEQQNGGQGFVAVQREQEASVRVIPGGLERVVRVGAWLREREESGREESGGEGGLVMKCTGCGEVGYCSKECQVKGWNEGGHKADCKIIKAIRAIWS
ncbi:hypothetical protein C8A03DRAFT_41507 [Achaetomium macrosporum]|uniref:MYND-type domain-containing protein n=1 Tax=Achaetomium macrosporum TaxID=79813 RepID=A0AAN7HDJ7_9PEZI|nr:hypothetical protein C8A03DRAFT_41507 [Achaetomium macrosporum]